MKTPKIPAPPPPPPPALSPVSFSGKRKPPMTGVPAAGIPATFLGGETAPTGQAGSKTLLGQ